jgi:DNA replication protein DnaD
MIQPVGYFKLWRELYTKPIWTNSTPEQKVVLMTIMAMANFRPNKWEWQGQQFILQEGQFITSLDSLVKECGSGVTIRNVRTALKRFENLGFLTNQSTKTGRLITVANWELYQGNGIEGDKESDKEPTKKRQRPDKDLTPKEEGKEIKKDKKDIYISCQHLSMTEEEYKKLVEAYGEETVKDKLEYAENYAKLKNYKSLYLTLSNWLKADKKKEGTNGTDKQPNGQDKPHFKLDKSFYATSNS